MEYKGVNYDGYEAMTPTKDGYYGEFGGAFLPKELEKPIQDITEAYLKLRNDPAFRKELKGIREDYQGRPTPLYCCQRLSEELGDLKIYLKREDLNHTGAHKLNHTMAEGLLAKYLGKKKLIAETGAGSHGTAVATAAAYYGLECDIYMGIKDIEKQKPNVQKCRILGARIIPVTEGQGTLKEAVDAAFEAYSKEHETALYAIGSAVGPHPFPMMIHDFQHIVGEEAKEQFIKKEGKLPDRIVACVGGGSNSIGLFGAFINEPVEIIGVEPLGKGSKTGENAATITFGEDGIIHGFHSLILKDNKGNVADAYSIASGLDYPSVGPEHAYLHKLGRVNYETISDKEALEAFFLLARKEGIIAAIESSHALAYAIKLARLGEQGSIIVNLSGRGDKDTDYIISAYGKDFGIN